MAHLGTPREREYRREQRIVTMICAEDAAQAEALSAMDGDWIVKACGLHPWKADLRALRDMEPWLSRDEDYRGDRPGQRVVPGGYGCAAGGV